MPGFVIFLISLHVTYELGKFLSDGNFAFLRIGYCHEFS